MKATLTKADLQKGISHVQSVVPSRSALPIISNVLLDFKKDELKLSATDLRVGIECSVKANVTSQGTLSVSATRLAEIVRELPEKNVVIESRKDNTLALTCEKGFFKIMSLPGNEFPALPVVETDNPLTFERKVLRELFQKTVFAISVEQSRYTLTGLLFELKEGKLHTVATDGRRMAYGSSRVDTATGYEGKVIIPDKMIHELLRLMKSDGQVTVKIGENQVVFALDGIRIVSQLIEGNFPDYNTIIPKDLDKTVVVDTYEFTMATRRAGTITSSEFNSVKLHIEKGVMVVSAVTPEVGEARDEIGVSYDGDEIEIMFNPGYLLDALGSIETDRAVLKLKNHESPGVLKAYESDDYLYVIMPIKD